MTDTPAALTPVIVKFGNPNPQMTHDVYDAEGNVVRRVQRPAEHISQSVTRVEVRPQALDPEHVEHTLSTDNDRALSRLAKIVPAEDRAFVLLLHEVEQIIDVHMGGSNPTWVSSENPELQVALAHHFGCAEGEPVALFTNAGRDATIAQTLSTSQPASFNFGALSANTGAAFAVGDTTLAGEIATAGGGLIRKQMTYAHTAGTNTATLTATWTANGTDTLPVTVASWANFNAVTAGTIRDEDALSATSTLNVSGDSLTVTYTLTLTGS